MPDIEVNDLATVGAVADSPPFMLPPEVFTTALNVRVVDGGLEKMAGWDGVFGTPGVAPHFLMPITTTDGTFWLYTSLTKAYGFDGTTHTEITRGAGDYTASTTQSWNGTLLGGIPIVNNGNDVPQFWSPVGLGTDLQNLTNWPGTLRAKVVRAFGPFLVAINITKSGTPSPHMVKWSHPADPGSVPSSWDETNPAVDAGESELPDVESGVLLDALPLAETLYLYKNNSVWKMRFVGGRFIFDFGKAAWLPTTGLLCARAVAITGDGTKHVWATQDDIKWHDGNRVVSVLNERQRRRVFEEMDTASFETSFMYCNPFFNEMWFCYPTSGNSQPNRAIVMHYGRGGDLWPITEADGITFRNAAVGPIEGGGLEDEWEDDELSWEADEIPWASLARRRLVTAGTDEAMFFNMDTGSTRNGKSFSGTLQREALALLGRKRNGNWIVDYQRVKLMDRFWPRITRAPAQIRIGAQELIDGNITWNPYVTYDPASHIRADPGPISGRATAIEITGTGQWRIDGYRIMIEDLGDF